MAAAQPINGPVQCWDDGSGQLGGGTTAVRHNCCEDPACDAGDGNRVVMRQWIEVQGGVVKQSRAC